MPVGLNYTGLILLLGSMAFTKGRRERWHRLHRDPIRWPIVAFVAWVLVVLAISPHHDETGLSLFHALRIAITLAVPLLLSVDEAMQALRGFICGALFATAAIVLFHTVGLPDLPIWHNVIIMKGNKSINDALLFTVIGASAAVYGLARFGEWKRHWLRIGIAFALTVATAAIVTFGLPSRTSLLGLLLAVMGACAHQWRGNLKKVGVAMTIAFLLAAVVAWNTPMVRQKFELGVSEIGMARAGAVSEGSWIVRYYMYRETTRMLLDAPIKGNGLGSWTPEWHKRGPELLHDYSMPHDDFLWLGAEMGFPALLAYAAVIAIALRRAWKRPDFAGRMAWCAMLILLVATLVNSALRDAAIGLSLPWIAMLYVRLASRPDGAAAESAPWSRLLPSR